MNKILCIIALAFLPISALAQGGVSVDLHSGDVVVWMPDSMHRPIPTVPAGITVVDSMVTSSVASSHQFFTVMRAYLDGKHFTYDTADYERSGLNASRFEGKIEYKIAIRYVVTAYHSSTDIHVARFMFAVAQPTVTAQERKYVARLKEEIIARLPRATDMLAEEGNGMSAGKLTPLRMTIEDAELVHKFGAKSLGVLALIDGTRSLRTIASEAKMKEEKVMEIVRFLMAQGYVGRKA